MSACLDASSAVRERTGPELVRSTAPFAVEDRARTQRLLVRTLALWATAEAAAFLTPNAALRILSALIAAAAVIRLFIFYHDYLHGAVLRDTRIGRVVMEAFGWYVLAVPSVWRETHNYHHQHNAELTGSSIGSYPLVTVGTWHAMSAKERLRYRLTRHPLNMLLGYLTVFAFRYTVSPFLESPRRHWAAPLSLLVHAAAIAGIAYELGWGSALIGFCLPIAAAHALGSYIFFAQHNGPEVQFRDRREWEYDFAALSSSTMFDMSPLMHWVTGNIGYHHVHHLNHRIPFYRLPEVMAAIPELQDPPRTSWSFTDVQRCLRGALWDPNQRRMIGFRETNWKRS